MPKSLPRRVDPVLLREARKRAKAEKRMLADCVETALREKLKRAQRKPSKSRKPAIELRGPDPAGQASQVQAGAHPRRDEVPA